MIFLDPLADPHWDEKVLAYEDASIFHAAAWPRVLRDTYGFASCHLVEAEGGRLRFVLPLMEVRSFLTGRRGVSLPFTDFCAPLTTGEVSGESLLGALVDRGRQRGWKYFEVRGAGRMFEDHQPATTVLGHTLDLGASEAELFGSVRESTRRNIKKASRAGVGVAIGSSAAMVEDYYRLHCLTRREHGLPPPPLSFFRNLHEHLIARGHGCIALATLRGQPVGGAVYFHFGRNALYKYGASDKRFLSLRPNDLVMWEAIRWYRDRGFRRLCFGRTEVQHEGLRRYKASWGVSEQQLPYHRYDFAAAGFGRAALRGGGAAATAFRRLPLGVSRLIGTLLYRHVA